MLHWKLEKRVLPLRFVWRISRSAIETKENFFVSVGDGNRLALGEVSPNKRYNNTPEAIETQFPAFVKAAAEEPALERMTLREFSAWLRGLPLCNSLRFGLEAAWIEWRSASEGISADTFVARSLGGRLAARVPTSFSVPIMELDDLDEFVRGLARFPSLKIKVDEATGAETIERVTRLTSQKLRIDGNEAWNDPDAFLRFVEGLRGKNIEFIEQPLPAAMKNAYRELLPRMPFVLIGDESIEDDADFADLKRQFHGVNIKLVKAGGVVRAFDLLEQARAHGLKTMVGCMVETSLGISHALRLCPPERVDYADLDGYLLLKEDPFGRVREEQGILALRGDSTLYSPK